MAVNNFTIDYAVEIDSGTNQTIPSLGMTDGIIRFVTGRPDTGSLVYEDSSPATDYYTGFMVEYPINGLSKAIDITTAGNFSSINNISVTISNINNYDSDLASNNIFLTNSIIRVYAIIDNTLYSRWAGTISETSYDTTKFVFKARDYNESFFKTIPKNKNDQIALGDIAYHKLKKEDNRDVILIDTSSALSYYEGVGSDGNPRTTLRLYINRQEFQDIGENDLKDYFVRSRQFGKPFEGETEFRKSNFDEAVRIIGNSDTGAVSDNPGHSIYERLYYYVDLYLERTFTDLIIEDCIKVQDYKDTQEDSPYLLNGGTKDASTEQKYVFDVIDIQTRFILSTNEVEDIETDENGVPITYVWDEDNQQYIRISTGITFINSGDESYFVLTNNSESLTIPTANYVYPNAAFRTNYGYNYSNKKWSQINSRTSLSNMIRPGIEKQDGDPDRSSFSITKFEYGGTPNHFINYCNLLELQFPDNFNYNDYDEVYLGMVVKLKDNAGDINGSWFGENGSLMFNIHDVSVEEYLDITYSPTLTDELKIHLVEPATSECYIDVTRAKGSSSRRTLSQFCEDSNDFSDYGGVMIVTDNPYYNDAETRWVSSVRRAWKTYYKRNTDLEYVEEDQDFTTSMKIGNFPFVLIKNRPKNTMFMMIQWDEALQGGVGGDTAPTDGVIASLRCFLYNMHLICYKNVTSEDVYVKVKGENIDGNETDDVYNTMRYLFEGVNGFSSGLMDYGNLPDTRESWDCARAITEQRSSKSYITDLARQSFVGVYTDRYGRFALDAFRERIGETPDHEHNDETINNLSIKSVSKIQSNKIYNDLTLSYNKLYSTGDFKYTMFINNADQDTYDSSYSNIPDQTAAEGWWETCNDSFNKNKVLQRPNADLTECNWYFDPQEFDPNADSVMSASIYYYLTNLIMWNTQQKSKIKYSIPINTDSIKIELLDTVSFRDDIITDGNDIFGWVIGYSIDIKKSEITVDLLVESDTIEEPFDIIDEDTPNIDAIIDEDDSQTTDIIEEDEDI